MNEPNWPILLAGLQALQSLIFYYYFKKWISVLWNFKDDKQKQSATPQRCQEHIWNVTLRQTVLFYSARCPTMINYMSAPMINSLLVQQREGNSTIMRAELTIRKSCQVLSFCLPHLLTPVTQIDTECKVGDHLLYHYLGTQHWRLILPWAGSGAWKSSRIWQEKNRHRRGPCLWVQKKGIFNICGIKQVLHLISASGRNSSRRGINFEKDCILGRLYNFS